MQIVNKAVTIAVEAGDDGEAALGAAVSAHNMAEQATTGQPPEVLLLGRRRRVQIPMIEKTVEEVDKETVKQRDRTKIKRIKIFFFMFFLL